MGVRAEMKLLEAILEGDSGRRQFPRLNAGGGQAMGEGLLRKGPLAPPDSRQAGRGWASGPPD